MSSLQHPEAFATQDRADVLRLVRYLETMRYAGVLLKYGGTLSAIMGQGGGGIGRRRVANLLRKYVQEIATEMGMAGGTYYGSSYTPSGRGAFGRLSGGRRGRYSEPRVKFHREVVS